MFTTRPRALFTNGRNVLVTSTIPQRLTSARRLNVLTGVHSIGQKESIAALFTNPHSPANMQSERKTESWLIKDLLVKPEPFILFSILFLLAFMNEISDQWKRRVNLFTHKTIDFARCSTIVFFLDACGFHEEPPLLKVIIVSFQVIVPLCHLMLHKQPL